MDDAVACCVTFVIIIRRSCNFLNIYGHGFGVSLIPVDLIMMQSSGIVRSHYNAIRGNIARLMCTTDRSCFGGIDSKTCAALCLVSCPYFLNINLAKICTRKLQCNKRSSIIGFTASVVCDRYAALCTEGFYSPNVGCSLRISGRRIINDTASTAGKIRKRIGRCI